MNHKLEPQQLRQSASEKQCVLSVSGITLDIGRQRLNSQSLAHLFQLAEQKGVIQNFQAMYRGDLVNVSEGRQALHTSLRSSNPKAPYFEQVNAERQRLFNFARNVREGKIRGCRDDVFTDVINIGIGGSEMGPRAVWHALHAVQTKVRLHFLASVDGVLLDRILSKCNPRSTLIIVSSKSFKTRETQVNASAVDQWLLDHGIIGRDRAKHIFVVSANEEAAGLMYLPKENQFHIWEWVGGRFSVWGAIGLPVMIGLGPEVFGEFLQGAEEMDRHALTAPVASNLPLLLALMSYWNACELKMHSHCVLPYDVRLGVLVPWLQQLEMESLGKTYHPDGTPVQGRTGLAVWGANGNEAQHSFYQWLREGTSRTSIDLLRVDTPGHRYAEHYRVLMANAYAQAEALVVRADSAEYFNAVSVLQLDMLTPRRLGALMAMYEHKTTMLGTLFGLNPFDQPGVELGKRLSTHVEAGASIESVLSEAIEP